MKADDGILARPLRVTSDSGATPSIPLSCGDFCLRTCPVTYSARHDIKVALLNEVIYALSSSHGAARARDRGERSNACRQARHPRKPT